MKEILPFGVKYIIGKLNSCGKVGYVVGGAVRDYLLGKIPSDFDITTDASPDLMQEIFRDDKVLLTGIKHGTLTVIIGEEPFEVTTFRIDGDYKDHRHPTSVSYTESLTEDLSRRDFTVNAIAYNETCGFVDPFFGRSDADKKIIKAVGEPERRFNEDALRILRCLRFAATLGFDIDKETSESVFRNCSLLSSVSGERIFVELKKLFGGAHSYRIIEKYSSVICGLLFLGQITLPEPAGYYSLSPSLRLLSLFALSKADPVFCFTEFCKSVKCDNLTRDEGVLLLSNLSKPTKTDLQIRELIFEIGKDIAGELIKLQSALSITDDCAFAIFEKIVSLSPPTVIGELCINGDDLLRLGFRGKEIGAALKSALHGALCQNVPNEKDKLIDFIMKGDVQSGI